MKLYRQTIKKWAVEARRSIAGWLDFYNQVISLNHRRERIHEKRRREQLFMTLAMMDAMGISNPAAYYTLELIPYMIQDFHYWHKRHGWVNSPLETIRCC